MDIEAFLNGLRPDLVEALREHFAPKQDEPVAGLDYSASTPLTALADIKPSDRSVLSADFYQQFPDVFLAGREHVKGPKGGVYFMGRATFKDESNTLRRATVKLSQAAFDRLKAGQPIEGYATFDDLGTVNIGVLHNFRKP